jgi:CIC family chloride channel protein
MKLKGLLSKFLFWRVKHISTRNFVIVLGGLTGILGGIAAVILKSSVHAIQAFFDSQELPLLFVFLPAIGILITSILAKDVLKEPLGHGITTLLYVISKKSSRLSTKKLYSRLLTSGITVGFGGSVGLEAPIVLTGSAIGSNIGQLMHMNYKQRTLLIGCGAAAAIAGIFNSPVAGVIFSIEVILTDVTVAIFIPLLIASVFGALISMLLLGDDVLFSFNLEDPFLATDFPYFLVLGAICGLVSVYFTRTTLKAEEIIKKVDSIYLRAIIGGVALGSLIYFFNPLFGEGYDAIKVILQGESDKLFHNSIFFHWNSPWLLVIFGLCILLLKPFASGITIGAGGNGGVFAPSMFLGAMTGFMFAFTGNLILEGDPLSVSNFTLVGMCGVMSGVLHAPLTAIFLIAEITSGYTLFLPLMLVSAIAYSSSLYFEKYSFYTSKLINSGDLIPYDRDKQLLSLMHIHRLIEADLLVIEPNKNLGDLVKLVKKSRRNIFPVVTENNQLLGIITLDDIREIMFDPDSQKNVIISTLMHKAPAIIDSKDNMQHVMTMFEKTGAWNLPVVDADGYVGIVSKSRIFNAYRSLLKRQKKGIELGQ